VAEDEARTGGGQTCGYWPIVKNSAKYDRLAASACQAHLPIGTACKPIACVQYS
jgi:hypothetical protein